MNADDFAFRFGGIERLYGHRALESFRNTHIAIVGLGGVGSWAAESLAKTLPDPGLKLGEKRHL